MVNIASNICFFVCLNLDFPEKRLEFVINDSGVRMIITDTQHFKLAKKLACYSRYSHVVIINLDSLSLKAIPKNIDIPISSDDDAFIVYTSGTTGKPKGIVYAHKTVLACIQGASNHLQFRRFDTLAYFYHPSFIGGVTNIFNALFFGASLLILSNTESDLKQLICKHNVTVLACVPSVFRNFISLLGKNERIDSIRIINITGEDLVRQDFELFKKHFSSSCLFVNRIAYSEFPAAAVYAMNKKNKIMRRENSHWKTIKNCQSEN